MRRIILLGATSLVLALGAFSANAQPTQPGASPYALINHQSATSALTEGRATYVGVNASRSMSAICR
jgi:hypothetical protein